MTPFRRSAVEDATGGVGKLGQAVLVDAVVHERPSPLGDDEADVAQGRISWASPLARAMIGAKVGDSVVWRRPAGETEVTIVEITY